MTRFWGINVMKKYIVSIYNLTNYSLHDKRLITKENT